MSSGYTTPYSEYVLKNFRWAKHICHNGTTCVALGCAHYYQWRDGEPPEKEQMRYQLATWMAFRKPGSQESYKRSFEAIVKLVQPLSDSTIFCDWEEQAIIDLFDQAREMLSNSVVLTSKTLHFFVPDLFLIIDRAQVLSKWKSEMRTRYTNPLAGPIDGIDGKKYVALLKQVRRNLNSAISSHNPVTLAGRQTPPVSTVDAFRLQIPLGATKQPNTLGKLIDNIVRGATKYEP